LLSARVGAVDVDDCWAFSADAHDPCTTFRWHGLPMDHVPGDVDEVAGRELDVLGPAGSELNGHGAFGDVPVGVVGGPPKLTQMTTYFEVIRMRLGVSTAGLV
jgi:hypothetical protein